MSQPSSNFDVDPFAKTGDGGQPIAPGGPRSRKQFDIYSMLLLLSFLFTLTAAIIFYANVK